MNTEPVKTGTYLIIGTIVGVLGLSETFFHMLVALNVAALDEAQISTITAFATGLAGVVSPWRVGKALREAVTPWSEEIGAMTPGPVNESAAPVQLAPGPPDDIVL